MASTPANAQADTPMSIPSETPMPTDTATPDATPTPTETPAPVKTPTPQCGTPAALRIDDATLQQRGCATGGLEKWSGYYQQFDNGWMLMSYDQKANKKRRILAFANDRQVWQVYYDPEYLPRMSDDAQKANWYWPCAQAIKHSETQPPERSGLPWRGFGRVWCDFKPIRNALGNVPIGSGQEKQASATSQAFENGCVVKFGGKVYVIVFRASEMSKSVDEGATAWMRPGRWK